jgi:hypothetical protein
MMRIVMVVASALSYFVNEAMQKSRTATPTDGLRDPPHVLVG